MPPRERLLTVPFGLAFAASFLSGLAYMTFLHLPGYLHELGATESAIGVIVGAASVTAIGVRPFVGRLMDMHGRRVALIGGAVLNLIACLLYLTVDRIGPWIFFVRAVHGVAEALMFSVTFTIAADIVPVSRRTEGIALFGISGMLPVSLGGLLGDAVLAHGTYQDLFAVIAVIAVGGLVASLPIRDSRPAPDSDGPARGFVSSVLEPHFLPVWLIGFGFAFTVASYFTFLKTYVIETGVGSVGLFFTAYSLAAVILRLLFGWVPDRFGLKGTLFPALLLTAAGAILLAQADTAATMAVAGVLCGAGHGYAFPIISALVVNRARSAERGAAVTAFTALFDVGLLIGSPALGAVAERWSHSVMFTIAAAVLVLAMLVFAVWDRNR